ncbi:CRE-KIN-9 protein [Caenorhabditis remanei]|uniref:CRE-KIN-9 protein n=1 Tax=Caenorhabditis remanei TaxID=31234 RepID=E3MUC1_CAERE|nr:CRE-KIN-9 protein [Caenorhabditis remanei]
MTHQCLTYLASSAALVSTLAFPTPAPDDSSEDWPAHKSKFSPWTPQPSTMEAGTQTDFRTTRNNNNNNNAGNANYLSPSDIRYLETITNLSQQALNNVKDTIDTINGVDPPPPTPQPRAQYPNAYNNPYQQNSWTPPPYPTLPPDRPTTPQYYDPYYGGDHKYSEQGGGVNAVALGLGLGIPLGIIACALAVFIFFWCRKRRRQNRNPFPMPFTTKKGNDYETQLDSPAYSIHDPWLLDRNNLEINYSKKLGSGAFCNVFKGKINGEAPVSTIHPGQRTQQLRDCPVAVKMLPSFADDAARSDFMQEINFMKSLAYHPHLVSMLGFVADRKSPYLLVEFCEHGDLLHMIRNRKQEIMDGPSISPDGLKIKDLLMFSWQISNGLEYLNNIGCIHRDIAARNVLVDSSNTCKIGDFGLCRLTDSLLYTARGGRLPLKWMAPESLSSYEYSFKSDVWSYGVLLWELFSLGEVPYGEVQTTELLQTHRSGKRLLKPEYCPDEIYDVMRSCWQELPDDRPAFQQTCAVLAQMLENATENYGYLIPKHFTNQKDPSEQCDNV